MTNEEAAAILESEAEYLYATDEPYNRKAFYKAIAALRAPELTAEEIRMIRKVVQCANQLYTVIEKTVTTNKADELLQKLRRIEQERGEEDA